MDLFTMQMERELSKTAPLAERMRPKTMDAFVGQEHLLGQGKYLWRLMKSHVLPSLLLYGPPGVGKTSLAELLAHQSGKNFVSLSAVTSNVKELRKTLDESIERLKLQGVQTVLFLDEIHRFNKSQQDVLLPYVERGEIYLMGATTENPYFYMNKALLSRMQVLELFPLSEENLNTLAQQALHYKERGFGDKNIEIDDDAYQHLLRLSNGDGRSLLNGLEVAVLSTPPENDGRIHIAKEDIEESMQSKAFRYDRDGNAHYDTISAYIKSLRGSDPDAALYYLAKMLESGEPVEFIGRRLIIAASEDVGNADPNAIQVAMNCFQAVQVLGMPEGRIPLAQATTYIASAPKSNASYLAIDQAIADVRAGEGEKIPDYLRDTHQPMAYKEGAYLYPHNYENGYVPQRYFPLDMDEKKYYKPTDRGYERDIKIHLFNLKNQSDRN